ncbi:MAG: hypothetical protein KJ072_20305 [Verrucomicrobia bacterium]|nr:hypothetical protein [Verrucomicrobiota bacterium]
MTVIKPTPCAQWLGALLAAGALAGTQPLSAEETWEALLPGLGFAPAIGGNTVLVDPYPLDQDNPGVFVGCQASSFGSATVLRLTPTDPSFSLFSFSEVDSGLASVNDLAHNPGDGLYAVGYGPKESKGKTTVIWKVRKSLDQDRGAANTWREEDRFFLARGAFSRATGVTTDTGGVVYVSGIASDVRAPHWIVRRKLPDGAWTTVHDQKAQDNSMVPAICFFPGNVDCPTPAVFTVGDLDSKWAVLRSQNQGATWTLVDDWSSAAEASAYDAACDSQGNLYVVGCRGLNGRNPTGWVVRISRDGGTEWDTLLDAADGPNSWASRVAIDGAGHVSLSGVIHDANGTPRWAVVRNNPQQPWSGDVLASWESRVLPFGEAVHSKGRGITADALGNLFLTGDVADWTDAYGNAFPGDRIGLLRLVP